MVFAGSPASVLTDVVADETSEGVSAGGATTKTATSTVKSSVSAGCPMLHTRAPRRLVMVLPAQQSEAQEGERAPRRVEVAPAVTGVGDQKCLHGAATTAAKPATQLDAVLLGRDALAAARAGGEDAEGAGRRARREAELGDEDRPVETDGAVGLPVQGQDVGDGDALVAWALERAADDNSDGQAARAGADVVIGQHAAAGVADQCLAALVDRRLLRRVLEDRVEEPD